MRRLVHAAVLVLAAAVGVPARPSAPGSMPIMVVQSPEEIALGKIIVELGSYRPVDEPLESPGGDTCQGAKIRAFGRAFARNVRCHGDAAARGAAVDPTCVEKARASLAGAFTSAEASGRCATSGDAMRMGRTLDRSVAKVVAIVRTHDGRSGCTAAKLDVVASTEGRVLAGYAASRDGGDSAREPSDWGYKLRRRFEIVDRRNPDCATRRDWRAVLHGLSILHDVVVPALWPVPSLVVAYWRGFGFRIAAWDVGSDGVTMDDFGHAWSGGMFPEEHAEVAIWSGPRPANLINDVVAIRCSYKCTTTYVRVDGRPAIRAEFTNPEDVRRIAVWVADGNRLRVFGMSDYEHAPTAARYRAAFDAMLEQIDLD